MTFGSVISSVTGGLWSKLSLYLGYAAIVVAIILGSSAIWFYRQNTQLHESVGTLQQTSAQLRADVTNAQTNLTTQKQALDDLAAVRATDAKVMNGLVTTIGDISKTTNQTKQTLRSLKEHSDEAKSYLDTPLPASVRSVLAGKADSVHDHTSGTGPLGQGVSNGAAAPARSTSAGH